MSSHAAAGHCLLQYFPFFMAAHAKYCCNPYSGLPMHNSPSTTRKIPIFFYTKMPSPLKLRAHCRGTPAKPSSTEQWHHAGKIQILLILLRGRQSCAPSTQHALHHSGQYLALLSSNRSAEQVLAKALLSAKLEEGSTTSRETVLSSCCSVGLLLPVYSSWTSSAQKGGEHNCIFVVTRVGCKDARRRIWEQLG